MFKKILIGLGAAFLVLLLVIASRPAEFKVERSILINAPASAAFPLVNDLHKANEWSPWAELDPGMKHVYDGPSAGVGASHAWEGSKEVGVGRQTIVESRPNELVRVKLDFEAPMKASNQVDFSFVPEGQGTRVSWIMSGRNNFVAKAFSLFFDMDKLVGADFEKGLAKLKGMAEAAPPAKAVKKQ